MRLALAMGRTLRELDESLGADEWHLWLAWLGEYDLPDGYFVAGRACVASAAAFGGQTKPVDWVPFYEATGPTPVTQTQAEIKARWAALGRPRTNDRRD